MLVKTKDLSFCTLHFKFCVLIVSLILVLFNIIKPTIFLGEIYLTSIPSPNNTNINLAF